MDELRESPAAPDEAEADGYWEDRGGYRAFVATPPARSAGAQPAPHAEPDPPAWPAAALPAPGSDPWTTPPPGSQPPPGFQPRAEVTAGTDAVAVVAFVLSFVGVLGLPLGLWARARTRRSGARGSGLATAAIVLSGLWLALLLVVVAAFALVGDDEEPVPGAKATPGTALKVGQCLIGTSKGPDDLSTVPCSQSHEAEVYAVFPIGSPSWPGTKVIEDKANEGCSKRFEGYVGSAAAASGDYDVQFYYPVEAAFRIGRRTISCVLVDVNGNRMIGSAKA